MIFFARLAESVEQIICLLPDEINAHRNLAEMYNLMEAYKILSEQHIITSSDDL